MAKTSKSRPSPARSRSPPATTLPLPRYRTSRPHPGRSGPPLRPPHSPFNKRRARPDAPEDRELTASIRALASSSLCSLDEQVRAGIADPDHPLSAWGVAHFEELALLDPAAQRELFAEYEGYLDELSPAALRQTIASRTHHLARAPWKLDDEALVPEAGACSACPLWTSREPLLFAEEEFPGV